MNPLFLTILKAILSLRGKASVLGLAIACLCQMQPLRAVTLKDFGYQNWNINGKLALGSRPILVIFVNFAGHTPLPESLSFYSNLVFNASQTPSMKGYYQASSDGAFSISGGAIMLTLPASELFEVYSNAYPAFIRDEVYCSNIIAQAMSSGKFDFESYDANHDGHITPDELSILIMTSDPGETGFGGSRPVPPNGIGTVSVPGLTYDWGYGPNDNFPNVALMGSSVPLIVWCEELEETWGANDIYGHNCNSMSLSPQSCFENNFNGTNVGAYYYLDPWNRLELGWCQPRIYSLTAGGIATISAAQAGDPTSPIILYDPARGTSEYFILEYRTWTNSVIGSGYDLYAGNDLRGDPVTYGLVIWHVQLDANYNLTSTTAPTNKYDYKSTTNTVTCWAENSPDLTPSDVPVLWGSNSTTPNLTWIDGTQTLTTIHVHPFNPGDNSITVEWLSAEDTWVDFNFTGSNPSGTFNNPYKTMAAGIAAASYGGTLHLKTGASSETPTITKRINIVGYNGPATIGN